jgi:hypothetical protein
MRRSGRQEAVYLARGMLLQYATSMKVIRDLAEIGASDPRLMGGKGASLVT